MAKFATRMTLAASVILAATAPSFADEELKIGAIAPLSGGGSAWGLGLVRGVELAMDVINSDGGITVEGKTYKLSVLPFDNMYNATEAKIAAERLVDQEKVKFIMGPIGSPGGLGSIPVTQPAKVIQFLDGYAPGILKNEWNGSHVFRIAITNREIANAFVGWVKKEMPDVKKVGLIAPNDAVGQMVTPYLIKTYEKAGIEVWADYYERGTKEFTPLLLRMLAKGVDLFDLNANPPGEAGLLIKQAREIGYRNPIVQSGGAGIDEIIDIAGAAAEGFIKYDSFDDQAPGSKRILDAYAKKYTGPMSSVAPNYYNATMILAEAIRRANSLDTDKVRDEMEKLAGWESPIFGEVVWTGKEDYGVNHQILLPFYLKQVENGKSRTIATISPTS